MIIGREKEQRELLSLLDKEESQFCAVYGRRRVGKTYLIRETFNYQFCFQHTGVVENPARVDPLRRNAADPRKHFYFDPLKSPGRRVSFILDFTCSSAS